MSGLTSFIMDHDHDDTSKSSHTALYAITVYAYEYFMHQNVAASLIECVSIALITIVGATVLVIFIASMFMKDERRTRIWQRLKDTRADSRYDPKKRRSKLRCPDAVEPTGLDDDVKLLQSYFRKRRRVGPNKQSDKQSDSDSLNHQYQLDIVSQEVQEWKKIQKDVKMQLTALNKAVQQLHEKKSQNNLPKLEKAICC